MRILTLVLLSSILMGCGNIGSNKKAVLNPDNKTDKSINETRSLKTDSLLIDDLSLYDDSFISELKQIASQFSFVKLLGDSVILTNDQITVRLAFPQELPVNMPVKYSGNKNGSTYSINLTRTSLTNISYELFTDDQAFKKGTAILSAGFILSSETGEDEGITYYQNTYIDKVDCPTYIGIETENANRVAIWIECPDNKSGNLTDTPILKKNNVR
jgi:hypothetical protein